jgi:AcrR family transcriptional regulator
MRITAAEKIATRKRILEAATKLFRTRGFETTTTRDVAAAAEIATGTLFNYFATKEAIVATLAEEGLTAVWADFTPPENADLAECLFALIAAELRKLSPLRKFLLPLLETLLSPLAVRSGSDDVLRTGHLEQVTSLGRHHNCGELSPVALQLYWSLYTGALAFWTSDASPRQEDTLALLDQSLAMFVAWLRSGGK